MLSTKDVAVVYETLLSSPGMNDAVKISFSIPRKNVLLLSKVIGAGLSLKDGGEQNGLLGIMDAEMENQLRLLTDELLNKAGLTEMNEKMNSIQVK